MLFFNHTLFCGLLQYQVMKKCLIGSTKLSSNNNLIIKYLLFNILNQKEFCFGKK